MADASSRRDCSAIFPRFAFLTYPVFEAVRENLRSAALAHHQFPVKFQCRRLVSAFGDDRFLRFAFMLNCAPQVRLLAIDLHKALVTLPLPL
jgi:hypothetical protein